MDTVEGSMAQSPVSRFTMYVLVWPNFAAARQTSGWLSRIHRIEHERRAAA